MTSGDLVTKIALENNHISEDPSSVNEMQLLGFVRQNTDSDMFIEKHNNYCSASSGQKEPEYLYESLN
jgi:hypothetical protein